MQTESNVAVSPTRYFWLALAALGVGLASLLFAHELLRTFDESGAGAAFSTAVVLAWTLGASAVVARAVHVIVTSAFSDSRRVFQTRHLLVCAAVLFVAAASTIAALVVREPFGKLLAHGTITGHDVIDVAIALAATVCMIGAGVAAIGAWDRSHEERNWHHTLHVPGRRSI
jgi:hypothetical protein